MLNDLILNKDLDACIACKNDNKFILFKLTFESSFSKDV